MNRRFVRLLPLLVVVVIIAVFALQRSLTGPLRKHQREALSQILDSQRHETVGKSSSQTPAGNQKALILASHSTQNVSWLAEVPDDWHIFRYLWDIPSSTPSKKEGRVETLPLPRNQGREAMAYLTFIVDHYYSLPRFMVFMHGDDRSWHQPERAANKLRALSLRVLEKDGYGCLTCRHGLPGHCPDGLVLSGGPQKVISWSASKAMPAFWMYVFDETPPAKAGGVGGGQFAVTAVAVKKRSLEFWKRMQGLLIDDLAVLDQKLRLIATIEGWPEDEETKDVFRNQGVGTANGPYVVGGLFEGMWHVLFGKEPMYCPKEKYCTGTLFAGAISCPETPGVFGDTAMKSAWKKMNCRVNQKYMARVEKDNDAVLALGHTRG